jgi:hypothetical protein
VSNHICEKELYQVYAEHLKELDGKVSGVQKLNAISRDNTRVVYEYDQSLVRINIINKNCTSYKIYSTHLNTSCLPF